MIRDTEDVVAELLKQLDCPADIRADAWTLCQAARGTIMDLSDRIDVLTQALAGVKRIAEKNSEVSGSRSLQTAMLAISHVTRAALHQEGIATVSGRNPATHEPSPVPRSRP